MITQKAHAKINLTLNITGKRQDGYHSLDTVMQTVSLFDTVRVAKSDIISVVCNGLTSPPYGEENISGENNIAHKAALAFFEKAGIRGGAEIVIEKAIPVKAGFGGGSSDAAAALKALNLLYGYPLTSGELAAAAKSLGADVPFLLRGGAANCKGLGEEITPLPVADRVFYCLCFSGGGVSTKTAFEVFDNKFPPGVAYKPAKDSGGMIGAVRGNDPYSVAGFLRNDFESVMPELSPGFAALKAALISSGAISASLSGSGGGVFGVFDSLEKAKRAEERYRGEFFIKAVSPVKP
ncbi:MAG: 4-(cytidine 5'-diphospho)-2-C-methyl-D-erythritol kinase [Eubacteriales bacterium]